MRLQFCGVRGSTPAPGAEFVRYGGHTSCVAVAHDGAARPTLILDVSDAEADLLLATHDPPAALPEYDRAKLDALLQEVRAKSPAVVGMLKDLAAEAGKGGKDKAPVLPPERFEIVVACEDEGHQREVYDRLTAEGLKCRVLTF